MLAETTVRNMIYHSVKSCMRESRFNALEGRLQRFLIEAENPAYDRGKAGSNENLRRLWAEIDRKQTRLQDMVFGELSGGLTDITKEKLKVMGDEHLRVPQTIARAGNDKLPPSVLMVNMSSSLMCPSYYLGMCTIKNGACYAQRGENQHTNSVLPNRWQTDLMHTQMLQQYSKGNREPMREYFRLIEMYIQLGNAYAANLARQDIEDIEGRRGAPMSEAEKRIIYELHNKYKISDVRLNETGDFHCQLAVDLWAKFARKIKQKYGISTHAYTARGLDFSEASKDITVNASHKGINTGDGPSRKFLVVSDEKYDSLVGGDQVKNRQPILGKNESGYFYKCPCVTKQSKCDRCGVCFAPNLTGKDYTIYVKYHGLTAANGFKSLFTKQEVEKTMERLRKNGWVTDDEYERYQSPGQQERLDKTSKKILTQRAKYKL